MKVFHINIVANSRSTGRIVEGIVRLSEKKGIQSYVAYGRWANESRGISPNDMFPRFVTNLLS